MSLIIAVYCLTQALMMLSGGIFPVPTSAFLVCDTKNLHFSEFHGVQWQVSANIC